MANIIWSIIIWWIILGIVFFYLKRQWDTHKESKQNIKVLNWFRQHLNWIWVLFFVLTIALAFSMEVYTILTPRMAARPMERTADTEVPVYSIDKQGNKYIIGYEVNPGRFIEGSGGLVVDEKELQSRSFWVVYLWFCPIYITGTIWVSKWALKQKNRNLNWLWLTILLLPITPLILSNKNNEQ